MAQTDVLITESGYENILIGLLKELGYEYTHGSEVPRTSPLYQDVYITEDFLTTVGRINAELPRVAIETALTQLQDLSGGSVVDLNMIFTTYIQDGVPVRYFIDDEEVYSRVQLLDYHNAKNNFFRVVNQYTFQERETKRPDIILFVNGMPLVLFELKSPNRDNTDTSEAYAQIPPFNQKGWRGTELEDDPRWDYGIPSDSNANFAWMQHMIHHLSQKGRIGMVLANGSLSSTQNNEGDIRQKIIEADLVEGIVALPDRLFTSTGIPCSLWFLNKAKDRPKTTLFVDARNMGTMVNRALRELTNEDIEQLATVFKEYRAGTLECKKGFTAIATIDDIKKQGYVLTPGRYVGIEEEEADDESFDEKMKRLSAELKQQFAEAHNLEKKIEETLKELGYYG